MKRILILGGGFAGVEAYQQLHKRLHPASQHQVQIELINRDNYFTFTPMLHEAATGSVAREHVAQALREMLHCCGKDFHQAVVTRIDANKNVVHTAEGREHPYDYLVISLGVAQGYFGIPGTKDHAMALKWLPDAVKIRNNIIRSFERASESHDHNHTDEVLKLLHFVIVGGGATGTEMAGQLSDLLEGEMAEFYGDVPKEMSRITLVHAGNRLLEQLSEQGSRRAKERLESLGVTVRLNEKVTAVHDDYVELSSGETLSTRNVFWTGGTESTLRGLVPDSALNERGLVVVDKFWRVKGHKNMYAIGDCATGEDQEYTFPPTAQAAVQAAGIAAANIAAQVQDKPLVAKKFQYKGDIIPIGDWYAIFERHRLHHAGRLAWLLRRGVFLQTMYSWQKRLQVVVDWVIRIFLPRDTSEF